MESGDEDIERDFRRLERNALTNGYREGVLEGSDSIFQDCFDVGYAQGFQSGLLLGFYQTILNYIQDGSNSSVDQIDVFKDANKANCELCKDDKLSDASSDEIKRRQGVANDALKEELINRFSPVLSESGLNSNEIKSIFNGTNNT